MSVICSSSIIGTGCSSGPSVIPFNQDKIDTRAESPQPKCEWPELFEGKIGDEDIVYMRADELHKQVSCQTIERTNYEIAANNAESVDEVVAAFNALVDKAVLHNNYAQNELTRVDEERKRRVREVMAYQGLIVIALVIFAL